MKKKPFVSLRPEITRTHALILMGWLEDDPVTRYLSDSRNVSRFIAQAIDQTQTPILTHLFNQGGRFFMVHDRDDTPVGFVRLVKTGREVEIVVVIGDHGNWGRGVGSSSIREGLKVAFLEMRADAVIAKIHPLNVHSHRAFERCGFLVKSETSALKSFCLTAGRYRRRLREGVMTEAADIYITETGQCRLQEMIEHEDGTSIFELEHELERAIVVPPERVAEDVVTMNSKVLLHLDDHIREVSLVYPQDADERAGKLSVLTEIGAAILGYRKGDAIDCVVSNRTRRILIDRLIYQPEARRDFHL
jgi:regulator of nucleoside diphosphate kinase